MRKTKIVCTIGPAITDVNMMKRLIQAGMNVARFNFSHGSHEEHLERIVMVRQAAAELGARVALMLDNRGPEIRLGSFEKGKIMLEQGATFTLTTDDIVGDEHRVTVQYPAMPSEVASGRQIVLDDGNLVLKVQHVEGNDIHCTVVIGGELSDRKKVNLPGSVVALPAIDAKDIADIRFAIDNDFDFVAASFIRKAQDIVEIRRVIEAHRGKLKVIAKIESQEGLDNLDEIITVVDGLMVARGDLGVEIPTENVPIVQKEMIAKCNRLGLPVITATQMLDSMIRNPRPTRAEANDVANAILDGSDAIMLSGETANGKYPVEAVETMDRIAVKTEEAMIAQSNWSLRRQVSDPSITDAIGHAVCQTALTLGVKAIVTATTSGYTARMIAKYRPTVPVIATTTNEKTANQLMLSWGVQPLISSEILDTDMMVRNSISVALDAGYLENGDLAVLTAGVPIGIPGSTNMLQVITVGEVLVSGMVIGGQGMVTGKAVVARTPEEAMAKMSKGDILIAHSLDRDYIPAVELAAGLITEEGGLSSSGAIIGLSLHIPVMVGAEEAISLIPDGMLITLDPYNKVYRGKTKQ